MQHVLFVCSQNRLRSPTAECIFAHHVGMECLSAGLNKDADEIITPELIEWADIIFVMEQKHRTKLARNFKPYLGNTRVICLDIPDDYAFMDPALVQLLKMRVSPFLPVVHV